MSGIAFKEIGDDIRIPSVRTEIDASKATTGSETVQNKILMFGQKVAAGTGALNQVFQVATIGEVEALAGVGSHMVDIYKFFAANNPRLETEIMLVADGTTAAVSTLTVSGPATKSAPLVAYVHGQRVVVSVTKGDAANDIAAALDAAINLRADLLFSSSVAAAVVTVTAKHKGEWTDALNLSFNRLPPERGGSDAFPEGVSVAVLSTASGAGNPDLTAALAGVPDKFIRFFLQPFNDIVSDGDFEDFLDLRFDANKQHEGYSYNAFFGTRGDSSTHGNLLNGKQQTTMQAGVGAGSISPEHAWAAAYAGAASAIVVNDPLLPYTGEELVGIFGDFEEDQLPDDQRNTLLFDGIATHTVDDTGTVRIERGITNYQKNDLGQPDPSFLDGQTVLTLSEIRQRYNARMTNRFGAKKLASDPFLGAGGGNTVTPLIIRGEIIAFFLEIEAEELVENVDDLIETLIVERDLPGDPNRVDTKSEPDLVNQLRLLANKFLFKL